MLNPTAFTAAVLDRILALLAPLFLAATGGDAEAARSAAGALLASYEPRTNRELRFAALAIAFSFGALDALSRSADSALTLNQVLRLRGNANALNRAAQQNESRLEKRSPQPEADAAEAELPASSDIEDLVNFVRPPAASPALSRQQRRFLERKEEKQRQREQETARLEERVARRMAEKAEAAARVAACAGAA
nr:hypothetical protein [uncultured Rhodopila sp.]